jgi:hypothetical protein
MSTAVPPMPSEAAQPGLSEPQRIVNVFAAPSKTFADLRRKPSWWAPWLIIAIFSLAVGVVVTKKLDFMQIMRDQIASSPQAQAFESLPPDQQERRLALGEKIAKGFAYATPIIILISGLIVAAILMATFNFAFEAEVPYSRSLAIVFYGWLPGIITAALTIIVLLAGVNTEGANPRNLVATNLAYFMDYHNTSKFLYGMAGSLDIITIWSIILIGIGFKVNSAKPKLSTGTAIGTVVALFVVWRLIISALGWV